MTKNIQTDHDSSIAGNQFDSISFLPTSASLFPSNKHNGSGIIINIEDNGGDSDEEVCMVIAAAVVAAAVSSRMGNCHTRTRNKASSWRMGCVSVNESAGGGDDGREGARATSGCSEGSALLLASLLLLLNVATVVAVVVDAKTREVTRKGALRASERSRSVSNRPVPLTSPPTGDDKGKDDDDDGVGGDASMEARRERVLSSGSRDTPA